MKKILITGENSYIGTSFQQWMSQFSDYTVDTISVRGEEWKNEDFSKYDVIFHVAGIAHADVGKVSKEQQANYYKVNRDLTVDVASKFKQERQDKKSQFIFMSSIIVYGDISNVRKKVVITPETIPNPANFYGDSKLQAEKGLAPLASEDFTMTIVRPPMIYGPNSKGNYQVLEKLADKLPVFPNYKNERSVLHVEKLCEFIKSYIDQESSGIKFPQNDEYMRTSLMVQEIAKKKGKNIKLFSFLNWGIILLSFIPGKVGELTKKAFGNLVYTKGEGNE
ncbi:NAD-dependent epimerase/dehydratase family protein [Vagococcus zengguangii]|uniref:NAD-dependent epimerase/dehydratase family protein n=1 Tax=Vagococcus zengguangii TaxID=2571750 RepID=UPI001109A194|nr:NAD-dependent epimerase/dehydratase family protein [Vagococcus zengguangii]TLG80941.1 NAD-dependent epimerase/dehydratase family protein [Vagococcus zengguangii]